MLKLRITGRRLWLQSKVPAVHNVLTKSCGQVRHWRAHDGLHVSTHIKNSVILNEESYLRDQASRV